MMDVTTQLRDARERLVPREAAFERWRNRRELKIRRSRVATIGFALLIGSVAIVGPLLTIQDSSRGFKAANGLDRLVAGPGEYYFTSLLRSYREEDGTSSAWMTEELWWRADGSGRFVFHHHGSGTFDYEPGIGPRTQHDRDIRFHTFPGRLVPTTLSESSDVLAEQLRAAIDGPSPVAKETFSPGQNLEDAIALRILDDTLFEPEAHAATPAQYAAMVQVLLALPGAVIDEDAADPAGRHGIEARFSWYGGTVHYFFDPDTLQPMARVFEVDGRATEMTLIRSAGITGSLDAQRPDHPSITPQGMRTVTFPGVNG